MNLSRHVGWLLLHPEPRLRGVGWAVYELLGGLFVAGLSAALFVPVLLEGGYGWPFGLSFGLFFGLYGVLSGILRVVPPRLRRVVLGSRLALTATYLMLILSIPLIYARGLSLDPLFEPFLFGTTAALVLLLLCRNYFVNLYRDRRSRSAA